MLDTNLSFANRCSNLTCQNDDVSLQVCFINTGYYETLNDVSRTAIIKSNVLSVLAVPPSAILNWRECLAICQHQGKIKCFNGCKYDYKICLLLQLLRVEQAVYDVKEVVLFLKFGYYPLYM